MNKKLIDRIKSPWTIAIVSIFLNVGLIYYIRMSTPFFPSNVYWSDSSLDLSGVFLFNDSSKRPDPKSMVQHLKLKCNWDKKCSLVETWLMGSTILPDPSEVTIIELNYSDKSASFEWGKCRINVVGPAATFACQDGDAGVIGSHIEAFYEKYGLF